MRKINKHFFLILSAIYFAASSAAADTIPENDIARQALRQKYARMDKILDILKIRPGMVILDIGAGAGYCSFLFAEKLGGTGQVFATDIRSDYTDYINAQAKARGLKNLSAHPVKKDGVDAFYEKHKYDLVYLSNVYHCFKNPSEYFKMMKGSLAKGGRLAIVLYNNVPFITVEDIGDFSGVVKKLSQAGQPNAFYENLKRTTKNLIKRSKGPISQDLKNALITDINSMLSDPLFYMNFYGIDDDAPFDNDKRSKLYFLQTLAFTDTERDFANWLMMGLRQDGVFEKDRNNLNEKEMRSVRKLNQLFFFAYFHQFLSKERTGFFRPKSDGNRQTSKFAVKRELELAGFQLAEEHKLSAYYDLMIYE